MIKVRFLGDNLVLLTPKGGERMDDLIKHNKEWFESFLEVIDTWSESLVVDHKISWVRCYGLPFSLWYMLMKPHRLGKFWNMQGYKCECLSHAAQG